MNNYSQPILQKGTVEFYADNGLAGALIDGVQTPIHEWPASVLSMISRDIDNHPGAESALEAMGFHKPIDKINQYTMCMYGELNLQPDFVNYRPSADDAEFTQLICGVKDCKHRGVLCKLIHADYGALSDREIEICMLMAQDLLPAEIADKLFISVNTLNTHITNIIPKLGVKNSRGIAIWALHHLQS